jgi:hypothetical protein
MTELDIARSAGAHCPGCHCRIADDEKPTQPATSSTWARRQAKEAVAAAVQAARESRKKPKTLTEEQQ